MVSFKTVAVLGVIIAAGGLFIGSGGFTGLGQKIKGIFQPNFSLFPESIPAPVPRPRDNGIIGPDPRTGTEEFDPLGNLFGNFQGLQNILDSINNFFTGGGKAPPVPDFSAPRFNDQQSVRDFNLIRLTESTLNRPINVARSVAATRELGGQVFTVISGGRERTFATEATAQSFAERISRV